MAEGYVALPVETNPDDVARQMIVELQTNIPGYTPADGHLTTWLFYAVARVHAVMNALASSMAEAAFRYYGQNLLGLLPVAAASATARTTWEFIDDAGYTVPAGTFVGIRRAGDVVVPFYTSVEFTVPPGSSTANLVPIAAVEPGEHANGFPVGPVELITNLASVDSIVTVEVTAGGVDAESDADYMDRLVAELRLLSPRPILPDDFAVMARRVTGVHRSLAISGYVPSRVVANAGITNGSANLTAGTAQYTADDVGRTVTAAGIPGGTTILAYVSPTQVTMSANATATTNPVAVTVGSESNVERSVTVFAVDDDGLAVSAPIKAEIEALLESEREVNFQVYTGDPSYTVINVAFTITVLPDYDPVSTLADAEAAVAAFLSPANWGGGDNDPPEWHVDDTTVRILEVGHVIYDTPGVDDVTALTLNGGGVNIVLAGTAPLPQLGTNVGTVA